MGEIWIREFTGGLDSRRLPETTPGGVFIEAVDGHITRGGEFETRAAFVKVYSVPGTVGLAANPAGLVVFGSDTAPSLPSGIAYQQLVYPEAPSTALAEVPSFDLFAGKVYAAAVFEDGFVAHYYDADYVQDWYDGRARASFSVSAGTGSSEITDITVSGVAIIGAPVSWAVSNSATAAAIAAAINSYTSTPDYEATSTNERVNIIAVDGGSAPNGYPVEINVATGFGVTPSTGIALAWGSDSETTWVPGTFVRTFGTKMYALSRSNLHFSGILAPTQFNTDAVGAGFIDMSAQASGAEQLTAIAPYQSFLAVFSEANVQIEYVDPDPANNTLRQVLNNTGAVSGRSVAQFGDNDVFYLSESGLRSLRARDASNSAATTDIGVPVDTLIVAKLKLLSDAWRSKIIGLIEPGDGRYWLIMKDVIFVFSYFSGAKVSAWTMYEPGFDVDYAVISNRRVFLRSGDDIYCYGGTGSVPVYDGVIAKGRLPYLDANKPATKKHWEGVDAALTGEWDVYFGMEPNDLTALDQVADIFETTYNGPRIPAIGASTHISLLFQSRGGYAKLGSVLVHHNLDDESD